MVEIRVPQSHAASEFFGLSNRHGKPGKVTFQAENLRLQAAIGLVSGLSLGASYLVYRRVLCR
jgi:hypothetical protein